MSDEEKKLLEGKLFCPGDPDLRALKLRSHKLSRIYSDTPEDDTEEREKLLNEMLCEFGEGSYITGPVFFHYGVHTKIGKNCFFNYNLTVQDDSWVTIGDYGNFGPNLTIVTPVHPMDAMQRRSMPDENGNEKHMCFARPVKIGDDCWFGADVTICPGVTIGDRCVIGAGSVVTRDIPSDSFAAGNPCRVKGKITEDDRI